MNHHSVYALREHSSTVIPSAARNDGIRLCCARLFSELGMRLL